MLLSVRNLTVRFGRVEPLSDVSFDLDRGEILGLVGESGSGKSLTAMAVAGLLPLVSGRISGGSVIFDGTDLACLNEAGLRRYRGRRIALVTQSPMTALDPAQRIGAQIDVVSRLHLGLSQHDARARTIALLTDLRIPDAGAICDAHPHQLSGGMKQRIVIAMALAGKPDLIIADEPTTALDVTIQAQILDLLTGLQRDTGMALILITHDMGVVAETAERVSVQYAGQKVEEQPVGNLFEAPHHPYTAALLAALPERATERHLPTIPGVVPGQFDRPKGCLFSPRCQFADDRCRTVPPVPASREMGYARCHYPLAAKAEAQA